MEARSDRSLSFAEKDLAAPGVRLPAARVLVFLSHTPEATFTDIMEGTHQGSPNEHRPPPADRTWPGDGPWDRERHPDDEGLVVLARMAV